MQQIASHDSGLANDNNMVCLSRYLLARGFLRLFILVYQYYFRKHDHTLLLVVVLVVLTTSSTSTVVLLIN